MAGQPPRDDLTDLDALTPWWPDSHHGTGWTLATTRQDDPRLTGNGRVRIDVDVYTPEEAVHYFTARLTTDGKTRLLDDRIPELAAALGHLPLTLGHAAAYMLSQGTPCTAYLDQFTDQSARLDELLPRWADTERYGRQVTTTLLLTLEAADQDPVGPLARRALDLIAHLDPAGHPADLWTTEAVLTHLAPPEKARWWRRRRAHHRVTGTQARAALRLLDRYNLITHDDTDPLRAVRIHALTARAVRESMSEQRQQAVVTTAADALLAIWPKPDQPHREHASLLRANAETLLALFGQRLWASRTLAVFHRAGMSLLDAGLHQRARAYWQVMVANCEQVLGADHHNTLASRGSLAIACWQAGQTEEAIALQEQTVADCKRVLGDVHSETLAARTNLAGYYIKVRRTAEANGILEQVLDERELAFGHIHPDTLGVRVMLAIAYVNAGRAVEAIALQEQALADFERVLGEMHPDTLRARANLAAFYGQEQRVSEAIPIQEKLLAACEQVLGSDHPHTLTTRSNLAFSYSHAGRTAEALALYEQTVADRERVLGQDHPDTQTTRANIAAARSRARWKLKPPEKPAPPTPQ